jgi:glycosyltransferase involved in cell wall biosynthesis
MKAAIVIPAYNEAATIRDLARRSLAQAAHVAVVDDGSTDGTAAALHGLDIAVLRHDVNRGKGRALATGFAWALAEGADLIVTLDGDGQHRPEDIGSLLRVALTHPHRLIIGARMTGRDAYPRARNAANRLADFSIGWAAAVPVIDSQSGLRVYPAPLLVQTAALRERANGFAFESEIVIAAADLGYAPLAVAIAAIHLPAGRASHFRPVRDIARIALMIAGYLLRRRFSLRRLRRSRRAQPPIAADAGGQSSNISNVGEHAG